MGNLTKRSLLFGRPFNSSLITRKRSIYLGNALAAKWRFAEAITCYRQAIRLKLDHAEAHKNLGASFKSLGRLDEAIACYRQAILIKPDYTDAYSNLGNAMKDAGPLEEAIATYRKVVQLKPDFAAATTVI